MGSYKLLALIPEGMSGHAVYRTFIETQSRNRGKEGHLGHLNTSFQMARVLTTSDIQEIRSQPIGPQVAGWHLRDAILVQRLQSCIAVLSCGPLVHVAEALHGRHVALDALFWNI